MLEISGISDKINRIRDFVKETMASSETLSMEVYNILSSFEKDLSFLVEKIESFISLFFSKSDNSGEGLVERLSYLRTSIEFSLNNLINLVELSEKIFIDIFGSEEDKSSISGIISATVEIDSLLLELRSAATNSSITATRLGQSGGAFGILSKEIQKESESLGEHFSNIQILIEENFPELGSIRESFASFTDLGKLQDTFSKLIQQFKSIETRFSGFEKNIKKAVQETEKQIPHLLSRLVDQDIFRQELEHITDFLDQALSKIQEKEDAQTEGFLNFVVNLSKEIFDTGARDFLEIFSDVQQEMEKLIGDFSDDIAEKLEGFGKFFNPMRGESLIGISNEIMIITIQNSIFIKGVLENLSSLQSFLGNFENKIEQLEDHSLKSRQVIKRFHIMKLLLKTELVRLTDFLGKKAKDIEIEFESIINRVDKKNSSLKAIIGELKNLYYINKKEFEKYEILSKDSVSKDDLKNIFESLKILINDMGVKFNDFRKIMETRTEKIFSLQKEFSVQIDSLKKLEDSSKVFFGSINLGLPDNDNSYTDDETIRDLVDQMTTYRERVIAQKHTQIDDVGSQGGDFTLF